MACMSLSCDYDTYSYVGEPQIVSEFKDCIVKAVGVALLYYVLIGGHILNR